MFTGFESPSYDALLAEQSVVQAEKFQGRVLDEYSACIFPGQQRHQPLGSAVVDFVKPIIDDAEHASLEGVLKGLGRAYPDRAVNWVDMGGGRALAMRQLASNPASSQNLKMTNVDLFNYGLDDLRPDEREYLEELAPGMTKTEAAPKLIQDNVETVRLPELADIITSVETIQYLNKPLMALANWYNQLADNGILLVATSHDWASWIRYNYLPGRINHDLTPAKQLLEVLASAAIQFAVTYEIDWSNGHRPETDPDYFRTLAVQKKPGTTLSITKPVNRIEMSPDKYKITYYEAPSDGSIPIVEVVSTNHATIGAITTKQGLIAIY